MTTHQLLIPVSFSTTLAAALARVIAPRSSLRSHLFHRDLLQNLRGLLYGRSPLRAPPHCQLPRVPLHSLLHHYRLEKRHLSTKVHSVLRRLLTPVLLPTRHRPLHIPLAPLHLRPEDEKHLVRICRLQRGRLLWATSYLQRVVNRVLGRPVSLRMKTPRLESICFRILVAPRAGRLL